MAGPVPGGPQGPGQDMPGVTQLVGVLQGGQDDLLINVVGRVAIAGDGRRAGRQRTRSRSSTCTMASRSMAIPRLL